MKYIKLEGESVQQIRENLLYTYGDDIYIIKVEKKKKGLLTRKVSYEVTAGIPDETYLERTKSDIVRQAGRKTGAPRSLMDGSLRETTEPSHSRQNEESTERQRSGASAPSLFATGGYSATESAGAYASTAAGSGSSGSVVQETLVNGKLELIARKLDSLIAVKEGEETVLEKYVQSLKRLDFDQEFLEDLRLHLESSLSMREAGDIEAVRKKTTEFISNFIIIDDERIRKNDVAILIGPTGVGKTTTIVKLAMTFTIHRDMKLKLLTADQAKLGGQDHLARAADILKQPWAAVTDKESFWENLDDERDLILVDTPGSSQKDNVLLAKIRDKFDVKKRNMKIILTVSATTKYTDLVDIFERFRFMGYTRLIITKTDETNGLGSIVSALKKNPIPISYITNGQEITDTLIEPDREYLLGQIFSGERYNA